MNDRFPCKRAYVLVLTVLLHSFLSCCTFEIFDNAFSASDVRNDFGEDRRISPGSSIEQLFLGPKERRNPISEPKQLPEDSGKASRRSVGGEKLVRAKRESPSKKSDQKNLKEGAKAAEKRSVASKASRASRASKSSLRADRPSRESSKQANKVSDYEAGLEDRSDYDEFEDEAVRGSDYKSNELKLTEDRFIDQDERSMLYDDFETKDVVKRGVAEDYEELEEEADDAEDSLEEGGSLEEDPGRRRVHSDARVKREHASKKREISAPSNDPTKNSESALKSGKDSGLVEDQAGKKESQVAEEQPGKAEKEDKVNEDQSKLDPASNEQTDQSKRNIITDPQIDAFKVAPEADPKQSSLTNDQVQIGGPVSTDEGKVKEEAGLSSDRKSIDEPPDLNGAAKLEDTKVDVLTSGAAKIETAASNAEAGASEDANKPENLNPDVQTELQSDKDYEKRVEEQIQRKIDSIKEEIKREIAESEKLKEIESNNAKFDELLDQEEDEEEQLAAETAAAEKRENPAKRSASNLDKTQKTGSGDKRLVKRKKRQNEGNQENVKSSNDLTSKVEKKSAQSVGKRSVAPSQLVQALKPLPLKKRDVMRNAYLVRRDRGKKRRRRRSRDSELGNLREDPKSQSPDLAQDERTLAELAAPADRKSGSVASLTGNAEELGPLASEYGEAFGGLQGEPGIALARFKRIKRVLGPQASKS
ncbi:uncharacterized protein LOC143352220 [Halictus rubicundus]|uniref:uncharacterized protein LOC143352220 n=1 Tax=Halictus rubicundus TaxID=77578 RepID=UPI0040368F8E